MGENIKFEDITSEFDAQDAADNKVISALSYLGILVLVPILAAKDSRFAKFHANQGLVMIIAMIALNIISSILGVLFGLTIYKIKFVGFVLRLIVGLVFGIANIGMVVLEIVGIVNALQGKAVKFPFVDKLTIIK